VPAASRKELKRDLRNFQLAEIRATKGCMKVYLTNISSYFMRRDGIR